MATAKRSRRVTVATVADATEPTSEPTAAAVEPTTVPVADVVTEPTEPTTAAVEPTSEPTAGVVALRSARTDRSAADVVAAADAELDAVLALSDDDIATLSEDDGAYVTGVVDAIAAADRAAVEPTTADDDSEPTAAAVTDRGAQLRAEAAALSADDDSEPTAADDDSDSDTIPTNVVDTFGAAVAATVANNGDATGLAVDAAVDAAVTALRPFAVERRTVMVSTVAASLAADAKRDRDIDAAFAIGDVRTLIDQRAASLPRDAFNAASMVPTYAASLALSNLLDMLTADTIDAADAMGSMLTSAQRAEAMLTAADTIDRGATDLSAAVLSLLGGTRRASRSGSTAAAGGSITAAGEPRQRARMVRNYGPFVGERVTITRRNKAREIVGTAHGEIVSGDANGATVRVDGRTDAHSLSESAEIALGVSYRVNGAKMWTLSDGRSIGTAALV